MGANFQTMRIAGSTVRNDVKAAFAKAQEDDRYENGHSYSGGFGMATGLVFDPLTFESEHDAEQWLAMERCQKWEDAIAVTFKDKSGETCWLIGAWCSC